MGWLLNFEESIKELLISLITSMLGELFALTSDKFGEFTAMIGQTPATWNPGIFSAIQGLSSSVIVPIANIILTLVVSLEFFGMLVERNNFGEMWSYIAYSGVLLFAIGKTDRISKSIFGAH